MSHAWQSWEHVTMLVPPAKRIINLIWCGLEIASDFIHRRIGVMQRKGGDIVEYIFWLLRWWLDFVITIVLSHEGGRSVIQIRRVHRWLTHLFWFHNFFVITFIYFTNNSLCHPNPFFIPFRISEVYELVARVKNWTQAYQCRPSMLSC